MQVKLNEGTTKDVSILEVTPENYITPDNEKHLYHCVIEVRKFNSETGKRLSVPRIQKFGKKGYESGISENLKKQGYTITVLYNPSQYIKEKLELTEKVKAEKAKANEDAIAKARAAEKDALKNEILEELRSAGIIPEINKRGRKPKEQEQEQI